MNWMDLCHGFGLEHEMAWEKEVHLQVFADDLAFIPGGYFRLWNELEASIRQFLLKTLLINRFEQPGAHFAMNLDGRPNHAMRKRIQFVGHFSLLLSVISSVLSVPLWFKNSASGF